MPTKIIFMGTPDFAVPTLDILVNAGYEISAVVTAPDKPAGRGQNLRISPVKAYALKKNLKLLQPANLKSPDFIGELEKLQPDIAVVVAFRMLPAAVWRIPKLGTFNLHASILPQYRGAAPINWAIINGETETGLTTFLIDEKIDTGNILLQRKIQVPEHWTAGDLHDHLMQHGAELVLKTVQGLEKHAIKPFEQEESAVLKPAPKIFREDCKINWERSAHELHNFIRGLSPWPGAWTLMEGKVLKVFEASKTGEKADAAAGSMRQDGDRLLVAAKDEWISLLQVQPEGKKRMSASEFMNGYRNQIENAKLGQ